MKNKKKGQIETVRTLILVLAIAIIMVLFVGRFTLFAKERTDVETCRLSILAADKSKLLGVDQPLFENLECSQRDLFIKGSNVIEKGKINDDKIKSNLAEAMYTCWDMVGRGNLDPYKDWDGNQKYCLVCNGVTFDEDFLKKQRSEDYKLNGLWSWMAQNNVPGKEISFYRFLRGGDLSSGDLIALSNMEGSNTIDTKIPYSIVWRMDADSHSFVGAAAAVVGGGALVTAGIIAAPFSLGSTLSISAIGAGMVGGGIAYHSALDPKKTIRSDVFLVPSEALSKKITINEYYKDKDFCTVIVN